MNQKQGIDELISKYVTTRTIYYDPLTRSTYNHHPLTNRNIFLENSQEIFLDSGYFYSIYIPIKSKGKL